MMNTVVEAKWYRRCSYTALWNRRPHPVPVPVERMVERHGASRRPIVFVHRRRAGGAMPDVAGLGGEIVSSTGAGPVEQ